MGPGLEVPEERVLVQPDRQLCLRVREDHDRGFRRDLDALLHLPVRRAYLRSFGVSPSRRRGSSAGENCRPT